MKKLAAAILCLLLVCCTALAEQEMSWQQMLQIATPSPIPPYLPTSTPEPTAEPKILLENMKKSVDEFVGDAPQFDDLTMLCIRLEGLP